MTLHRMLQKPRVYDETIFFLKDIAIFRGDVVSYCIV